MLPISEKGWSISRRRGDKPNLKKTKAALTKAESSTARGRVPEEEEDNDDDDGIDMPDWIEDLWDNSDRHAAGFGIMEKIFGKSSKYVPEERSR